MTDAVTVEHLTVNYDKTPVLWDINFSIPAKMLVGIIGPNGAGKSSLLKALLEMVRPLSGHVEFFGLSLKKARQKIAYVPQRSSVDWDFPITVLDVVLMGRYGHFGLFKRPKAADIEGARRALDCLGMLAYEKREIRDLSGGQQQRVFLARALFQDAEIYLMDEPFAGVDAATEKAIIQLLNQLKEGGKTLLIVHHDLHTVPKYFDWVILLNTCLVASGAVGEVFNKENIVKTYGPGSALLDEAVKISHTKTSGLRL